MPAPAERPKPVHQFPAVVIFVVSLAGRFTIDRVVPGGNWLPDTRVIGATTVAFVVYFWRISQRPIRYRHQWPSSAGWTLALIGALSLAAFWAPATARLVDRLTDLAALAVLVMATVIVTAADPRRTADWMLRLILAAAVIYAAAAVHAGPGIQGRYSAFGGGPNVYARVVCMGVIAAVILARLHRRKVLLLLAPVLFGAAFLSGSRGSLAALVGAVTLFLPVLLHRLKTGTVIAATTVGVATTYAIWAYLQTSGVAYRFSAGDLESSGYSSRPELLRTAWTTFLAHPIVGAGMDTFWVEHGQFVGLGYVHDLPAAVASETGLVGVTILVGLIWAWIRDGHPWRTQPAAQIGCALCAVLVFLSSLVSGDHYDTRWVWILGAVAVARRRKPATPDLPTPTRRGANR